MYMNEIFYSSVYINTYMHVDAVLQVIACLLHLKIWAQVQVAVLVSKLYLGGLLILARILKLPQLAIVVLINGLIVAVQPPTIAVLFHYEGIGVRFLQKRRIGRYACINHHLPLLSLPHPLLSLILVYFMCYLSEPAIIHCTSINMLFWGNETAR